MAHLAKLVIFHVNVNTCQNFNLPHMFIAFLLKKLIFWDEKFQINKWYPNMIQTMWNEMVTYTFNFHKDF
jgi:hypothetical protein